MNKTNENRVVKLSEIGILIGGNGFPLQYQGNDDGVYPFYKVSDMNSLGNEIYMKESNNYVNNDVVNNLKLNVLPKNAIVFAKVGAAVMLERKRLLSKDSIIDNNMMALIVNDKFYYKYIYHSLVNEKLHLLSNTGAMPSINAKNMYNLELFVPSYNDQVKIDEILTTWDLAIDKIIKIKQELTTFKDSIIKKYTLPSYIVKQEGMEWIEVKLKDILVEENEKTTINNQYDILTSTVDSIVLQSEYFNRQIASKNNKGYKIVKKDRLVISPQNAWMGNININTKYDIGIVSPSYKIYKLNDVDCKYFKHYVKTEMFRVLIDSNSQTGASIVRKSLKIGDLLSTTLKLPDIDIQKKLGSYFDEIDELIIKYNELHQEYERQKQGLMQQLLTGKMKIEKD